MPPPQSTSVSVPFLMASVQVGAAHILPKQRRLVQSEFKLHPLPFPQAPQAGPPQSTSVSVPFLMASKQLVAKHMLLEQAPVVHWELLVQEVGHAPEVP